MALTPDHIRSIPMLRGFSDEQLAQLANLFQRQDLSQGKVLFEAGDRAVGFYLLTKGEVTIHEGAQVKCQLWPTAPIGELGAIAGLRRVTRATVTRASKLWYVPREALLGFFESHSDIALPFYQNLVALIADKVHRDQIRLEDMRRNLIRTQKAMKEMRDYLLESPDTPISETLHNKLEDLIRNNRRINYRVEPPDGHPATIRFDDGSTARVSQISRTHMSYHQPAGPMPSEGQRLSSVLCLGGPEIPMSAKVLRMIDRRVDVELDLLLDEYGAILDGYLTRVQMLDFML
jgi:CRP-like cAMP-binding protein